MENVYEQFFALMYYGRWDFQQAYSLPIGLRKWFMERLIKQKKEEREAQQEGSSASGTNKTYTLGKDTKPPRL